MLGTVTEIGPLSVRVELEDGYAVTILPVEFRRCGVGPALGQRVEVSVGDLHPYLVKVLGPKTESQGPYRYDVNASCFELDGAGADGAYDLVLRDVTAEEVAERLFRVLVGPWGVGKGDGPPVPSRLQINIGPAGTGDTKLPL